MSEKDITALVKKYEQALQANKNIYLDADDFLDLADYYDSIDEIGVAAEVIDAALTIHPDNNELLLKKAKIAAYDGEYLEALDILDHIGLEDEVDYYLIKIESHLHLKQYKEAVEATKKLLESDNIDDIGNIYTELGFLHVEADCFKEAILYFQESLKYESENLEALSDMAYSYEMIGEFEQAIKVSNKILDIEPYSYETWVNIGKLYSLLDEFEKSIDAFDFALTINETDINILKLKAHCLSLAGRSEEAIEMFNELKVSDNDDATVDFLLAECYQALELYDQALLCLENYRKVAGTTPEYFAKKASLYLQKGEVNLAKSIVDMGLEEYGDSMDLNIVAGEIAFKKADYKKAKSYYLKIYSDNLDNPQLIDRLAILNIKLENYLEAIKYSQVLLSVDPNNQAVKIRLALLYFELDDYENFNNLLDQFSNEELLSLFSLIYTPQSSDYFDREMLIFYLNKAREARGLFKNLEY